MGNFDTLRLKREEDGPRVESERRSEFHLSKQQKAGGCGLASCSPPPERTWAAAAAISDQRTPLRSFNSTPADISVTWEEVCE